MTTLVIQLIFLISLNIFNNIQATPVITDDSVIEKDLKSYLEIIKSRADLTADPCNDFSKYACHNMNPNPKERTTARLSTFVEPLFVDNEPQNEAERKVRDLHLSCLKVMSESGGDSIKRIKYIMEQIPDLKFYSNEEEVTTKDIAKMFVKLHLLGVREDPIYIEMYTSQLQIIVLPSYVRSNVEGILTAANYKDGIEEIKKLSNKINDFIDAKSKVVDPYDYIKINLKSIDELKNLVPSNNINWDEIHDAFKDGFGSIKTGVTVGNIDLLKQLIEIVDTTDKHTIMNYLTLRYVEYLSKADCSDLENFYRYAILSRLWNDRFSDETIVNRFVTFLDEFEALLKDSQKLLNYRKIDSFFKKLNSKRHVAKNYKTVLPDQVRDEFYKNIDIDKNNFYKSVLQVTQSFVKDINRYNYNEEEVKNSIEYGLKMGSYDHIIKSNIKNATYLQLFSTIGYDLWSDIVLHNRPSYLDDFDPLKKCSNKITLSDDFYFIMDFISQKLAYSSLLHASEDHHSKLYKEKELIESQQIDKDLTDLKKLYFIGYAQHKCDFEGTTLKNKVIKVLSNSIEFSKVFECPVTSPMNKTPACEIEMCDDNIKKYSILLPINPGQCYQNIF